VGTLAAEQFVLGTKANNNGRSQFIYDSATGGLYFDLDGIEGRKVGIAILDTGLFLSHENFMIV
jgi:Ca2+-binding RTX toxin-like protein